MSQVCALFLTVTIGLSLAAMENQLVPNQENGVQQPKSLVACCTQSIAREIEYSLNNKLMPRRLDEKLLPKDVIPSVSADIIKHSFRELDAAYQVDKTKKRVSESYADAHVISSVAISEDGYLIVGPYKTKTSLRSWSSFTSVPVDNQTAVVLNNCGNVYDSFTGHESEITAVAISADKISKAVIATSSKDKTAKIWRVHESGHQAELVGHTDTVTTIKLSASGDFAITGAKDATVRIWHTESGRCLAVLEGHADEITAVSMSLNGKFIASASKDKTVRIWDTSTSKCVYVLTGHAKSVTCLAFSSDSNLLVSGSADKTIRLWQPDTGFCLGIFTLHQAPISGIDISADGNFIVSCDFAGTALMWQVQGGCIINKYETPGCPMIGVAISPDCSFMAVVSARAMVYRYNITTPVIEKLYPRLSLERLIESARLLKERKRALLASALNDRSLQELADGELQSELSLCNRLVSYVKKKIEEFID